MSDDVADRAEAALEGTSPEPWHIPRSGQGIDSGEYGTVIERGNVKCMSYCYGGSSTIEGDNLGADLRFIAAARSLVPELVAELKTTRAQRDEFHAQLDDALKDYEAVRAELIDMVPPEVIDMPLKDERQATHAPKPRHPLGRCGDPSCGGDW